MVMRGFAIDQSLLECGVERLRALCRGIGFDAAEEQRAVDLLNLLIGPMGELPASEPPHWLSDLSDDSTPFEFSLAIDNGTPELRLLIEAQSSQLPSVSSNWRSALQLNADLKERFGIDLERLRAVESLFAPTNRNARFGAWHAVCLRKGAPPDFKIYLNPQAQGHEHAFAVVTAALTKLGFDGAYAALMSDRTSDEIKYFSLDLSGKKGARVKIYTAHPGARVEDIEAAVSMARDYVPGQAAEFCRAMAGFDGPYNERSVLTCLAFTEGNATPTTGTIHFPVRAYAENDLVARDRILQYLDEAGASLYRSAIDEFANRPLETGVGMQTYASLRQERGKRRVTVYLATEIYGVEPARTSMPPVSFAPNSFAPASHVVIKVPEVLDYRLDVG